MSKKIQKLDGPAVHRNATITAVRGEQADGEEGNQVREVELSFSSDLPYTRSSWFSEPWVETLSHDKKHADFSRLNDGAPLLYNHNTYNRAAHIGIVDSARIEDGKGKATVRLSNRSEVDDIWRDIQDGILKNVSVGYRIHERQLTKEVKNGPDEFLVTKWEPLEVSILGVPPADASVGIGRSAESADSDQPFTIRTITEETEEAPMPDNTPATPEPTDAEIAAREAEIAERALAKEQKRRSSIRKIFERYMEQWPGMPAVAERAMEDHSVTLDQAREMLLDELGRDIEPINTAGHRVEVGASDAENFRAGVEMSLLERSGFYADGGEAPKDLEQNRYRGYSMIELARMSLDKLGLDSGGDKLSMVGRAVSHSSSDFPILLQNVANKSMLRGWEEAEETYSAWTASGSLSDFKEANRVDLNLYPNLPVLPEGAEYTYATVGERGETVVLVTYGSIFSITRQALINDDLSVLSRIPRRQGRAASRTIGDQVYAQLTSNPLMSDGTELFHADHGNLANPASAPTTQTIDAMRVAMMTQKDPDNIATNLNIRPEYILTPAALEGEMRTIMESQYEVRSGTARNHTTPNSVRGMCTVISDARLDAASSTAWYGAASPNRHDTIEVSYLDGRQVPFLDQKQGWNVDGGEFKVRIDFGVKALDFKALYKNAGA